MFCHNSKPGGIPVQPVDDKEGFLLTRPGQVVGEDAVGRLVPLPVGGDGEKPGGLVDDDEVRVLIDHGEGQLGGPLVRRGQDGHGLSRLEGVIECGDGFAPHLDLSLAQKALYRVAGLVFHMLQEEIQQSVRAFHLKNGALR